MKSYYKVIRAWDTVISAKVIFTDESSLDQKLIQIIDKELEEYVIGVDACFSTFREDSLIERLNKGAVSLDEAFENCPDFKEVYYLAEKVKRETAGLFNHELESGLNLNAIVKGYAAQKMLELLKSKLSNYDIESVMVNAGGDCAIESKKTVVIGLTNPDNIGEIYECVEIFKGGVATSGTYVRGNHIESGEEPFLSASVWGPNPALADAYATAALVSKDLNLDWLPKDYKYSILPKANSRVIYQNYKVN